MAHLPEPPFPGQSHALGTVRAVKQGDPLLPAVAVHSVYRPPACIRVSSSRRRQLRTSGAAPRPLFCPHQRPKLGGWPKRGGCSRESLESSVARASASPTSTNPDHWRPPQPACGARVCPETRNGTAESQNPHSARSLGLLGSSLSRAPDALSCSAKRGRLGRPAGLPLSVNRGARGCADEGPP